MWNALSDLKNVSLSIAGLEFLDITRSSIVVKFLSQLESSGRTPATWSYSNGDHWALSIFEVSEKWWSFGRYQRVSGSDGRRGEWTISQTPSTSSEDKWFIFNESSSHGVCCDIMQRICTSVASAWWSAFPYPARHHKRNVGNVPLEMTCDRLHQTILHSMISVCGCWKTGKYRLNGFLLHSLSISENGSQSRSFL